MLSPSHGVRDIRTHNVYKATAVCVFLLLAVALVFGQTVRHEFVNYDDGPYVYENPQVAGGLTARGIAWALTASHGGNWHPLTGLSHMLDVQLYGLNAGGHHLTNVLLHAAAAILLFLVLWRMTGFLWRSAFVAAVFAIHPLRVESVAWVAERKDVLSGLFFMLTLWAYVGYARRPFSSVRYLAVAVLFSLGLMAKPMLVTLPFVLLLLDYWPLGRMGPLSADKPPPFPWLVIVEKLPLMALTIASCVATIITQSEAITPIDTIPISSRISNALVSYVAYIGDLFYPVGLAVLYPHPGSGLPIWKVAASTLALTGITTAAVAWRRRFPYLFVGWFWYVGMLVPVIGLVQVGSHSMADRYTYLPQIGLSLCVTWGIAQFAASRRHRCRLCGIASALVILLLMGLAWRQTSYWRDSETLWTHALACTADNYTVHNDLGVIVEERGRIDEAIAHFQKALKIKPNFAEAHHNLGNAFMRRGQADAAITHYQKSLELWPGDAKSHNNLGVALAGLEQVESAIIHFQRALEIQPDYAEARFNLGRALDRQGKTADAVIQWREAVRLQPNRIVLLNQLAWVLATCPAESIRNGAEAVDLARRAVRLSDGRDAAILDTLAAAYAETGRFSEAVETVERAVSLASVQGNAALADIIRPHIKLFRTGVPYREATAQAPWK